MVVSRMKKLDLKVKETLNNSMSEFKRDLIESSFFTYQSLLILRPLVLLGFSHGYFQLASLAFPSDSFKHLSYFESFKIQDI